MNQNRRVGYSKHRKLALVLFHVETKARPTHLTAGEPSKRHAGSLRLLSILMTFDPFLPSFTPWHALKTHRTHRGHTQTCSDPSHVPCLWTPDICLPSLSHTHSHTHTHKHTHTHTHTHFLSFPLCLCPCAPPARPALPSLHSPFSTNLRLADLGAARTDQTQTGREKEPQFILCRHASHGQTSLGKQSLERGSCKLHRPEWHDPSNYLSALD